MLEVVEASASNMEICVIELDEQGNRKSGLLGEEELETLVGRIDREREEHRSQMMMVGNFVYVALDVACCL